MGLTAKSRLLNLKILSIRLHGVQRVFKFRLGGKTCIIWLSQESNDQLSVSKSFQSRRNQSYSVLPNITHQIHIMSKKKFTGKFSLLRPIMNFCNNAIQLTLKSDFFSNETPNYFTLSISVSFFSQLSENILLHRITGGVFRQDISKLEKLHFLCFLCVV